MLPLFISHVWSYRSDGIVHLHPIKLYAIIFRRPCLSRRLQKLHNSLSGTPRNDTHVLQAEVGRRWKHRVLWNELPLIHAQTVTPNVCNQFVRIGVQPSPSAELYHPQHRRAV